MSDIETEKFRQIGIDLINEYRQQRGIRLLDWLVIDTPETSAFIRSIQLHEKTKQELADCKQELTDFRQDVSDAVMQAFPNTGLMPDCLGKIIIPKPKPDPLINVAKMLGYYNTAAKHLAGDIRSALDAAGFEIREKNDGQPNSN